MSSAYQLPRAYLVSATRRILHSRFESRTVASPSLLYDPLFIQDRWFIQQHGWSLQSVTTLIGDFVSHGVVARTPRKVPTPFCEAQ